jgi:hypothetical protein
MKVLELDKLPVDPDATKIEGFLGVTDNELWGASKEYERRMKKAKDPHAEFGLKCELIIQVAGEVSARNMTWIKEHLDAKNPVGLLGQLYKAPRDKPTWVLQLLRRHGFTRVELPVWVAADVFLGAWVERSGQDVLGSILKMTKG